MRVDNSIGINDYMTGTLRSIIRTMNMMISNMEMINRSTRTLGVGAFDAMQREILSAEISLERLRQELINADRAQRRAGSGSGQWGMNLMGIYSLVGMIRGVFGEINRLMLFTDKFTGANARLNLTNDGLRTQVELQERVLQASRDTRASYVGTADLVAKIGMTGAMDSTDEAVGFAEKVNKLLTIGGGGAQQNEATLLQLSQALASGKLQGDEYRSLRENAPALMSTIAQGLGVGMGDLKQMSTDGLLTAEAMVGALEKMGTTIDEQFAAMPVTFGQNMQMMKDTFGVWMAGMAEDGGLKKLNDMFMDLNMWLAGESGQEFLQGISDGLYIIAHVIEIVVQGFQWISGVMEELGPIADMLFYGLLLAGAVAATTALWGMVAPILVAAGAFIMANLPIIAIGAAIAGVVMILNKFGIDANTILTFVGGLFGGLFALIGNGVILVINVLMSLSEFLINIFIDPVYAVKKLFYDLTNNIAEFFWGVINAIIEGISWIITKTNEIAGTSFKIIEKITYEAMPEPTSDKDVVKFDRFDYLDYKDYAGKGADLATGFLKTVDDKSENFLGGSGFAGKSLDSVAEVGKVGKIDSEVDISKEDIKYLLDATTQKYVNQVNLTVQTQAPVINNNGTVREEADINKVATALSEKILEKKIIADENM